MVLGTPILRNPHIVFMVCSIFQHLSSRNLIYEPLATASIVVRHVFLIIGAPGSGAPQHEQIPHQDKGHLSTKRMGISAIKNDDVTDVTNRLCLDIVEIFPHQLPFYFFDKKPVDLGTRSLGKPWWEDRCQTTWDPALGASTSQILPVFLRYHLPLLNRSHLHFETLSRTFCIWDLSFSCYRCRSSVALSKEGLDLPWLDSSEEKHNAKIPSAKTLDFIHRCYIMLYTVIIVNYSFLVSG